MTTAPVADNAPPHPSPHHGGERGRLFSGEDIDAARRQSDRAAQLLGLEAAGRRKYRCPVCGKQNLWIKPLGVHCYTPGCRDGNQRSAIDMLLSWGRRCGLWEHDTDTKPGGRHAFTDAVLLLNGREPAHCDAQPATGPTDQPDDSTGSVVDTELLTWVSLEARRESSGLSLRAAQEFYGRFGVSGRTVADNGAAMITDEAAFKQALEEQFGWERVHAAGLTADRRGRPGKLLFDAEFSVFEPHVHPGWPVPDPDTGEERLRRVVTSAQFRGGYERERSAADANRRKKDGEDVPWYLRTKLLSVREARADARCGHGAHQLSKPLVSPTVVFLVEGYKNYLAMSELLFRSPNMIAYGLPGVGARPPEAVCELLTEHSLVLALDNDEGGQLGRDVIAAWLWRHGARHIGWLYPSRGDPADVLQQRVADGKPPAFSAAELLAVSKQVTRWLPEHAGLEDDGATPLA